MKPEENQIINELNFCMIVLNWNRAQENPPIEITKEYFVAQELLKLFSQGKQYPESKFDDPRVQIVYEILCADEAPPKGEHWEGFIARRIVDALAKPEQEFYPDWDMIKPFHERIKELEEQLVKPEQEPVAWVNLHQDGEVEILSYKRGVELDLKWTPLYTSPPRKERELEQAIREERGRCHQLVWDYGFSKVGNNDVQEACATLAKRILAMGKK